MVPLEKSLNLVFLINLFRDTNYRVHKPGVPNGPASQQKLGPADDVTNDAQLLGWPRYLNDRPEERSSLRPKGLDKEGTMLASDYDPRLCPEGLAKEATTLAFDSDLLL